MLALLIVLSAIATAAIGTLWLQVLLAEDALEQAQEAHRRVEAVIAADLAWRPTGRGLRRVPVELRRAA